MIAFFDTSVHVDLLRGDLRLADVIERVHGGPVRLSPVVASELLRGASGKAARSIERLISSLVSIEPPLLACRLARGRSSASSRVRAVRERGSRSASERRADRADGAPHRLCTRDAR